MVKFLKLTTNVIHGIANNSVACVIFPGYTVQFVIVLLRIVNHEIGGSVVSNNSKHKIIRFPCQHVLLGFIQQKDLLVCLISTGFRKNSFIFPLMLIGQPNVWKRFCAIAQLHGQSKYCWKSPKLRIFQERHSRRSFGRNSELSLLAVGKETNKKSMRIGQVTRWLALNPRPSQ